MLLMSLLSSADKLFVLLVLPECGVVTRSVDKLPVLLVLSECGVVTRSVDKLPVLLVLLECGVVFCSADKPVVLLVLPEWLVFLRRGVGLGLAFGLAFGFAAGLGFVTAGFGLLRVMVLCAAMPMGQSMMSRVRMMCLGFMMCALDYLSATSSMRLSWKPSNCMMILCSSVPWRRASTLGAAA